MAEMILGWRRRDLKQRERDRERDNTGVGLLYRPRSHAGNMVSIPGEGHAITIAPTGAGKGRNVIIPNLLHYPGPVIVIDPKGENFEVTARQRRRMGHRVIAIDPFHMVATRSDSFDPIDVLSRENVNAEGESTALANLLSGGKSSHANDSYWDDSALSILSALIFYAATSDDPDERSMLWVYRKLRAGFISWCERKMRFEGSTLPGFVARGFQAFNDIPNPPTRGSVLSHVHRMTDVFQDEPSQRTIGGTTLDLDAITRGDRITIYIVLPPSKLRSHGPLLRLWVGGLMKLIMAREKAPQEPTLFLIDECAQLGELDELRVAMTLLRSYGLRVWTFFQDFSQISNLYRDWETLINNASVLQAFGVNTPRNAQSIGPLLGMEPSELLRLPRSKLAIRRPGATRPEVLDRLDYLNDEVFMGQFDKNRYY